jgi:succinate-semialdehyde dehydrogenase/glutarate-semialdehyde dehydrogenase
VIDDFISCLQRRISDTFRFGSVWDSHVNFGPLYSRKAFEKIEAQIEDALSKGAKIVYDKRTTINDLGPNFFPPTVLVDCTQNMLCMRQETFGPVAFLTTFETEDEVLREANKVDVGLASYFYTESISRLWRVSEALEAGMVGVGVGIISACEQPFGGIKDSGVGREGGKDALDEYTDVKSITIGL